MRRLGLAAKCGDGCSKVTIMTISFTTPLVEGMKGDPLLSFFQIKVHLFYNFQLDSEVLNNINA